MREHALFAVGCVNMRCLRASKSDPTAIEKGVRKLGYCSDRNQSTQDASAPNGFVLAEPAPNRRVVCPV